MAPEGNIIVCVSAANPAGLASICLSEKPTPVSTVVRVNEIRLGQEMVETYYQWQCC